MILLASRYEPLTLAADMWPVASTKRTVDLLEDEIGHVSLTDANAILLLLTLNKQGTAVEHRCVDRWEDARTFVWQSQRSMTSSSNKGREIVEHEGEAPPCHTREYHITLSSHCLTSSRPSRPQSA